jgi:ABC-type multidrug transport system ATPase subunit
MKMVACSSPVTEGELKVMGMNPRVDASRIKARLGVIPQQDNLDTDLTVRSNASRSKKRALRISLNYNSSQHILARRVGNLRLA